MTSNEYPPPSQPGEDSTRAGSDTGNYGGYYPPAPGAAPHPASYGSYGAGSSYGTGDEPRGTYPGQQSYPGQQAYPGQAYPAPQGYPASQGYPATQGYPAQSGYQGAGYPGYQHTQQLPPTDDQVPPADDRAGSGGRGSRPRGRTLLATALLAALLGGGVGGGLVAVSEHDDRAVNTGLRITNDTGAPAAKLDGTIAAAAAKIRPSVVTIEVSGAQESGTGSGVVIRQDGYILTNDHVVSIGSGSGQLRVTLADGRTAAAKIVGRDTSDDLAVIKVDLTGLTAATFAKSSSLSVGQAVVAVGAPLGLSDTVTSGIVSNLARPVRAGDQDQAVFEAVQTDAAINPGNSGGPLVDLNGSVVGINAAIATDNSGGGLQIPGQPQQSGNIGIGFAIPADEASRIASELIATGKATHAVLGVEVGGNQSSTSSQAGVALRSITAGGAAAKAGLKVGDVVTSIDGQRVTTSDSLIAAIRNHAPGQQASLTYLRGGKSSEVNVTLGSSSS
ncbi:trypsin-like peptidase domain-containing protein [Jatrophihabitans sp.]|uniref:trypsin-like peptidase domain-containing protein n=1 Tax=Jatrophihabitans sp. TaxID=1932789 RepID=UPI002C77734A|nr:trypsin-like peptidase domain-containing protein [Jatrophihabitans sp.]